MAGSRRARAVLLKSLVGRHADAVERLDPGHEREVAFARSQRTSWIKLSPWHRVLGAVAVVIPLGLVAGVIAALAGGPWIVVALGAAALGILVVLPHVLMPERMVRLSVRLMTPSAESMRRGESNESWPG